MAPGIAHFTGSCSSLISLQDSFQDNFAEKGGGALFLSDLKSTQLNCSAESSALANTPPGCPNKAWTDNEVSHFGYGPIVAYSPASVRVTPDELADYISNGTALPLITVTIHDQGNTQVTQGEAHHTSLQALAMSC